MSGFGLFLLSNSTFWSSWESNENFFNLIKMVLRWIFPQILALKCPFCFKKAKPEILKSQRKNPTIFNIIHWLAGSKGQTTHPTSV